jgi:pimeloyl-ACP methyl ester carboxylesterase
MDAYGHACLDFWRWLPEVAPSERAFLEAFFLWIYTPRAHADGTVEQIIEESLAFPHKQTTEAMQRSIDAFREHDTLDRLGQIEVPALVLTGELDMICPQRHGRAIAAAIPGARFELLQGEAHQPFQEVPDRFNAMVDAFWREVDA